jgi:uncharacterized membrane protein YdjX (TVP38/TMEM64 family)
MIKNILKEKKGEIILGLIFLVVIVVSYLYFKKYYGFFHSPEKMKEWILSYGNYSVAIFLLIQIFQVVIFIIPGEVTQIAGGVLYGTLYGAILSLVGISIGSSICFGIVKVFGKKWVDKVISGKDLKFIKKMLDLGSKKNVIFAIHVIPGIPKDIIAYICGASNIKFRDYFVAATLGRIPGIIMSALFGANLMTGNYVLLIAIAVSMTLLFVIGFFKGEMIMNRLFKRRHRERNQQKQRQKEHG